MKIKMPKFMHVLTGFIVYIVLFMCTGYTNIEPIKNEIKKKSYRIVVESEKEIEIIVNKKQLYELLILLKKNKINISTYSIERHGEIYRVVIGE